MADAVKYTEEYWQEQLDSVMDNFDFGKVAEVMAFLGWKWHRGTPHVPDVYELRKTVRTQTRKMLANGLRGYVSGGFHVVIDYDEGVLTVQFILEEWNACLF